MAAWWKGAEESIGGEGMEQDSKQSDGRGSFIDRYVVSLLKTPIRSLPVHAFSARSSLFHPSCINVASCGRL